MKAIGVIGTDVTSMSWFPSHIQDSTIRRQDDVEYVGHLGT